jgi:hypothetical protein
VRTKLSTVVALDKKWRKILYQNGMHNMIYFFLRRLNEKRMGRLSGVLEGLDLGMGDKLGIV